MDSYELAQRRDHDPKDKSDVVHKRKRTNLAERAALIQRLRPSGRCDCGRLVTNPLNWQVSEDQSSAICRSCSLEQKAAPKTPKDLGASIFEVKVVTTCKSTPLAIWRARTLAGISIRNMAQRCGWSLSHQQDLEKREREISIEDARRILGVLSENLISTTDSLPSRAEIM